MQLQTLRLREAIALGQRIRHFRVAARDSDGQPVQLAEGTSVGSCRVLTLAEKRPLQKVTLFVQADAAIALTEFAGFA